MRNKCRDLTRFQMFNDSIQQQMYFGDQTQLLNSLDDDWSVLLKNIKRKEEIHLSLLHKNKNIINRNRQQNDQQELQDEIKDTKQELNSIKVEKEQFQKHEKAVIQKYEAITTSFEDVIKLLSRVGARILQITQNSLEKLRLLDLTAWQKHSKMKKNLVTMLNQKDKLNIEHLFSIILDYSQSKLTNQVNKADRLLKALQAKDYSKLKEVVQSRDRSRVGSVQRIRELMTQRKREYSLKKQDRSASKRNESSHKHKNRGILYNLYCIMNLTKYQFGDQYAGSVEQKKQRIFNELLNRNRKNKQYINIFQLEQPSLQTKTKSFEQRIQKKSCQKLRYHNKSFTQTVNKNKKQHNITESITFNQYLATETELTKKQSQEGILKKGTKNKFYQQEQQDFPYICNKTMVTQDNQKGGMLEMSKKESMFQNRKRKLPQINRGTSLDNKYTKISKLSSTRGNFKQDINNIQEDILKTNKRKQKWFRDDKLSTQRTKIIMKNVQVGGIPLIPKKQEWLIKRQEVIITKQRKKTDTMGDTNTAYCKRTLNKFFDTKMNGFV